MPKLGIAIPWRPQPSRITAFDYVCKTYKEMFPDADLYFGDMSGDKWNISGSRNIAVEKAITEGCDVVLVSDADVQPEKYSIEKAITQALNSYRVILPYTDTYFLDEEMSNKWINNQVSMVDVKRKSQVYARQIAGAYVITPKAFEKINGWDERFVGWGYEDLAFVDAHETLIGSVTKVHGVLISLFHKDRDKSDVSLNESRYELYKQSIGNESLMAELIKNNRFTGR